MLVLKLFHNIFINTRYILYLLSRKYLLVYVPHPYLKVYYEASNFDGFLLSQKQIFLQFSGIFWNIIELNC